MTCDRFLIRWDEAATGSGADRGSDHAPRFDFTKLGSCGKLTVFVGRDTPSLALPGGRGWVIGRLFRKDDGASPVEVLTPREAERVASSQGQALVTEFWGNYLAVLCPSGHGMPFLLRDASGFMPCYILPTASGACFASDVGLLYDLGILQPSVAWQLLHAHLKTPELRRQKTCIAGVSELGQGHALAVDGRSAQRMVWSPLDHVRPLTQSRNAMAGRLESVILSCTSALARPFGHVLVGASGGLDSSIVCAALAEAGHPFTCLTMATKDPSGDERRYVRALAHHLKREWISSFYEADHIDPARSSVPHLPRPVGRFFMQQIESAYRDAWLATDADAILTGNGGDNIFAFLHAASPVVDRWLCEGFKGSTFRTMTDMCRITGCDAVTMLRGVWRGLRRRHLPYQWPVDERFLIESAQALEEQPVLTPWLDTAFDVLPGKRAHIASLMRIQHVIEGYAREDSIPVIPVLLAQPVVELCLSIPTWLWCENGTNRSMARRAFAKRLPPAILQRTSKTGPESLSAQVYERAVPVIREQLLDGLLARHGLIDARAVEEALARTATRKGQLFHRLLALAEAEAWSRHWHLRQAG